MSGTFKQIDRTENQIQQAYRDSDAIQILTTKTNTLQQQYKQYKEELSYLSKRVNNIRDDVAKYYKDTTQFGTELTDVKQVINKAFTDIEEQKKKLITKEELKALKQLLETEITKKHDRLDYVQEERVEQLRDVISTVLDQSVAETEKLDMLTTVLFSTLGTYNTLIKDQNEKHDIQYWINWGFTGIAGILTSVYIYDHWDLILGAIK